MAWNRGSGTSDMLISDEAAAVFRSPPSSFTAINIPPSAQPPTPAPSNGRGSKPSAGKHRRNPVVAGYLGLSTHTERAKQDQRCPPSAQVEAPRKRTRAASNAHATGNIIATASSMESSTPSGSAPRSNIKQKRVTDGYRVSKSMRQTATPKDSQRPTLRLAGLTHDVPALFGFQHESPSGESVSSGGCAGSRNIMNHPTLTTGPYSSHQQDLSNASKQPRGGVIPVAGKNPCEAPVSISSAPSASQTCQPRHIDNSCTETLTVVSDEYDDDEIDDFISTLDQQEGVHASGAYTGVHTSDASLNATDSVILPNEDTFDEGLDDSDFLTLTTLPRPLGSSDDFQAASSFYSSATFRDRQKVASGEAHTKDPTPFHTKTSERTVSSMTQGSQHPSQKMDMEPIVRPAFPAQVRDRSPIIGLSPQCLLRTCFRVGEAISAGRGAEKHGKNVLLELYARVISTERDGTKQYFVFGDLFHARPPYLKAEYSRAIWGQVPLYEQDSRLFLEQEHLLCRCVGRLKRNRADRKDWILEVMNIWVATKADILWVKGIISA